MNKILLVGCGHMGSALLATWYNKTSFRFGVIDPKNYKHIKKNTQKKYQLLKLLKQFLTLTNII